MKLWQLVVLCQMLVSIFWLIMLHYLVLLS